MNNYEVGQAVETLFTSLKANPPAKLSDLPAAIEAELEARHVPYGDRRLVAMRLSTLALALAPAANDPVMSKLLKKIASYALDVHDRWAGGSFFTSGPRRETKALLAQLELEARATASAAYVVDRAVGALVGGMERSCVTLGASLVNATRELGAGMTGAAAQLPAPIVNVNSNADIHLKTPEMPKPEAPKGKSPKRIGPETPEAPEGEPTA